MSTTRFSVLKLSIAMFLVATIPVHAQSILYVDDSATGANDGSSWWDAHVYVQDALAAAAASGGTVTEIRVAGGIYRPDCGANQVAGDRQATFQLLNGVALRGGYAGFGAPDPNVRVVGVHETVLSGDLNADDAPNDSDCCQVHYGAGCDDQNCEALVCTPYSECCNATWSADCAFYASNLCTDDCGGITENSRHIVTGTGTGTTAVLDGFVISSGNADALEPNDRGAGMYNRGASPTVTNCTFKNNTADMFGGGMCNYGSIPTVTNCRFSGNTAYFGGGMSNSNGSSPTVTNCTFNNNAATYQGGGMYNSDRSSPTVINCTFVMNTTPNGGGMCNSYLSAATVTNCTFSGNSARNEGGGMFNARSDPVFANCTFGGNTANFGGGMSNSDCSSPTVTNCTFTSNTGGMYGGGMYNNYSSPILVTCIVAGNTDSGGADESAQIHGGTPSAYYSNVQGWTGALGGVGNIGDNPLFVDGPLGAWTVDGTYDPETGRTTLIDNKACWNLDAFVGQFLNPNTSQPLQAIIVSNTSTEFTVLGNFSSLGTTGATYEVNDYRLSAGSPCIDAGDNAAVPADAFDLDGDGSVMEQLPIDLCGSPRFVDDPLTTDTGRGTPPVVDMGAYEYQIEMRGDCNANRRLDLADVAGLTYCMAGPGAHVTPECDCADTDVDEDVDLLDFAVAQRCMSGTNGPVDPMCTIAP